jgi:hypothetical protein
MEEETLLMGGTGLLLLSTARPLTQRVNFLSLVVFMPEARTRMAADIATPRQDSALATIQAAVLAPLAQSACAMEPRVTVNALGDELLLLLKPN